MDREIDIICNNRLVTEENELIDEILINNGMTILVQLMTGDKSETEIIGSTDLNSWSLKLKLSRLVEKNIVAVVGNKIIAGKVENVYSLIQKDLNLSKKSSFDKSEKENIAVTILRAATDILYKDEKNPNMVQASFIKASPEKINEFKKEIAKVYEKYVNLEDENEEQVFGLINIMGSYNGTL